MYIFTENFLSFKSREKREQEVASDVLLAWLTSKAKTAAAAKLEKENKARLAGGAGGVLGPAMPSKKGRRPKKASPGQESDSAAAAGKEMNGSDDVAEEDFDIAAAVAVAVAARADVGGSVVAVEWRLEAEVVAWMSGEKALGQGVGSSFSIGATGYFVCECVTLDST